MLHHQHTWWKFYHHQELRQIYLSTAIRSFAISLISLFIPLYLYKEIGLSLSQTLYFYVFYAVVFAIATPLAAKFAARYGVKHTVLLSVPFYFLFVLLLYLLPDYINSYFIILIGTFMGLSFSFYWLGIHLIFYRASDHRHRGEEVGKRIAISVLATVLGPITGGFLIKMIGFKKVFIMSSFFLILSSWILFRSKENHVRYHFSFRTLVDKKYWQSSLFFVSQGTRIIAEGVLWPLFIFFILNDYFSLGIVGSLVSITTAVFIFVMGKFSDHVAKKKIVWWIIPFDSLAWFLRAFVHTFSQVFSVTIFAALTHSIREVPLSALEYDKAQHDVVSYFVSREIFICLGRILMLMFVIMVDEVSPGFIFQGIANFVALLF